MRAVQPDLVVPSRLERDAQQRGVCAETLLDDVVADRTTTAPIHSRARALIEDRYVDGCPFRLWVAVHQGEVLLGAL